MARIRTIKPGFFTSLTIATIPRDARLTFIGLWTHCDDEGRCVYEPRLLKAALWPLDDDMPAEAVALHIDALVDAGLVQLYTIDGRTYLAIAGFSEHQKVERRTPSRLPAPPSDSASTPSSPAPPPDTSPRPHRTLTESSPPEVEVEGNEEEEGKGEEGVRARRADADGPLADCFADENHRAAYAGFRRSSQVPDGFDGALRAVHEPPTGGAAYPWAVIGAALVELRGNSERFNTNRLRGYCRDITAGGNGRAGAPTGGEFLALAGGPTP